MGAGRRAVDQHLGRGAGDADPQQGGGADDQSAEQALDRGGASVLPPAGWPSRSAVRSAAPDGETPRWAAGPPEVLDQASGPVRSTMIMLRPELVEADDRTCRPAETGPADRGRGPTGWRRCARSAANRPDRSGGRRPDQRSGQPDGARRAPGCAGSPGADTVSRSDSAVQVAEAGREAAEGDGPGLPGVRGDHLVGARPSWSATSAEVLAVVVHLDGDRLAGARVDGRRRRGARVAGDGGCSAARPEPQQQRLARRRPPPRSRASARSASAARTAWVSARSAHSQEHGSLAVRQEPAAHRSSRDEGAEFDAGGGQRGAYGSGHRDRAGGVTVQAHRPVRAAPGRRDRPFGGLVAVGEQGAGPAAVDQPAVVGVAAVDEVLADRAQAALGADPQQRRVRAAQAAAGRDRRRPRRRRRRSPGPRGRRPRGRGRRAASRSAPGRPRPRPAPASAPIW